MDTTLTIVMIIVGIVIIIDCISTSREAVRKDEARKTAYANFCVSVAFVKKIKEEGGEILKEAVEQEGKMIEKFANLRSRNKNTIILPELKSMDVYSTYLLTVFKALDNARYNAEIYNQKVGEVNELIRRPVRIGSVRPYIDPQTGYISIFHFETQKRLIEGKIRNTCNTGEEDENNEE